ncbi:hypothetical protein LX77_02281 [Gelidibacter algens]|uniref:Uncharacterized protein n=1 Tax=Gelidibacter algens TaxID=49280 RepID=A0A1A7R5P3_9FLAO|nr:hypothetical protein [Gelidibacter algens]OBX26823.1 hypothetical protein A9996_03165 [Gelidibacter algens]RAJ22726.1 hypothetical protein LX77_02281 [Gelidibacter algens]
MTNSKRFRFPKTVVFGITSLYIIIMLATYFLYFKEPVIDCAKRLLLAQSIALGFQIVLNYFNYHSKEKIVILATLFVSAMIVSGVISSFFNFGLMCQYLGF